MIRLLTRRTLRRLLRTAARARHDARTARRDLTQARDGLAEAYARNRALVSHLARRDDAFLLPVLVPADEPVPAPSPLTVLALALWRQAAAEREAFRQWVTEDPHPADSYQQLLQARTAEAASAAARKDAP